MTSSFSSIRRCAAALLLGSAAAVVPAHATVLYTSPSSTTVTAGAQFHLTVNVKELELGRNIGAFDMDLLYDATRFSPYSITFGSALGVIDVDQITSVVSGPGRIDFAAISLLDSAALQGLQTDAFALVDIGFIALSPGSSLISLDNSAAFGPLLSDQDGNVLPASVDGGSLVDVQPSAAVPEPTSGVLVATAAFLVWRSRRIHARRQ